MSNLDEFAKEVLAKLHEQGIKCGLKIAELAKQLHPNSLLVVPLYRSCMVVEQDKDAKEAGYCKLHFYADPHWLGEELTIENLKKKKFSSTVYVKGQRSGPDIIFVSGNETFVAVLPTLGTAEILNHGLKKSEKWCFIEKVKKVEDREKCL